MLQVTRYMIIVKPNKKGINQAIAILKQGGVIVFPTDTAYGLGGKFNSKKVISKILKIKNRQDKKFTIVAASITQAKKYFKLNSSSEKLAKKYWPGPLSVVVSPKYSVRVPKNKTAIFLAKRVATPLIATSANVSGKKTLYSSQEIIKQFGQRPWQPDLIIDAGKLPIKKTSTIVKVSNSGVEVIRLGSQKITDY